MDNKATTKRMIGAVVLVLVAALLLAWLLKGKNRDNQQQDLALNQPTASAPILGLGDTAQKPQLVNEDPNAAVAGAAQQPGVVAVDAIQQQTAQQPAASGNGFFGGLFSGGKGASPEAGQEVKMPTDNATQQVTGKTDLSLRPPEVRDIVDTDGKVKDGTGSMGTGSVAPKPVVDADKTGSDASQAAGTSSQAGASHAAQGSNTASQGSNATPNKPAASNRDVAEEKKPAVSNKVVLVNEKPVPRVSPSAEEVRAKAAAAAREAAAKEAAMREAAAAKAAAAKAAAEKAAADAKAKAATAGGATAGTGQFAVQVLASADKANADALAATLKGDGYNVAVAQAQSAGKTVYRVNVTGFANRADAEAAKAKLKARYKQNTAIQGSFVTGG